jgi:hypothetical protein
LDVLLDTANYREAVADGRWNAGGIAVKWSGFDIRRSRGRELNKRMSNPELH